MVCSPNQAVNQILKFLTIYFIFLLSFSYLFFNQGKNFLIALILIGFYAPITEIIQFFLPYRDAAFFDLFFNYLGILFNFFYLKFIENYFLGYIYLLLLNDVSHTMPHSNILNFIKEQ